MFAKAQCLPTFRETYIQAREPHVSLSAPLKTLTSLQATLKTSRLSKRPLENPHVFLSTFGDGPSRFSKPCLISRLSNVISGLSNVISRVSSVKASQLRTTANMYTCFWFTTKC